MKKLKNYVKIGMLFVGISLLLWSCEKETIINEQPIENIELNQQLMLPVVEDITLKEALDQSEFNNLNTYFKLTKLKDNLKSNSQKTTYTTDTLGITIVTNSIKKITLTNYISYTMLMYEPNDTSTNVSNLVIQEKNGVKSIYTVRYLSNSTSSKGASSQKLSGDNLTIQTGIIPHDGWGDTGEGGEGGGSDDWVEICTTVTVITLTPCLCSHDPSEYCDGCDGTFHYTIETQDECYWDYVGSTNSDTTQDNNGSGTPTGGGDRNNTNDSDIVTTPIKDILPEGALLTITDCINPNQEQTDWLNNSLTNGNSSEVVQLWNFINTNGCTRETKNFAKEAIDALILNIPVIFDIEKTNIYQGNPLNFQNLTPEQKVAVLVYAVKKVVSDDTLDYVDIRQLFYNLPTVSVHIVAKIPVNGKLLDVGFILGTAYNNLQINPYPNGGRQYGPLSARIGNYIMDGYWWTLKYRTHEPSQSNSAEALYIQVKQKGQYNYENGSYFENFLGY